MLKYMITISLIEKPNPTEAWLVVLPKEYRSHVSLFAFKLAFLFIHSFPDSFINLTVVAEGIKAEKTPVRRISVTAVAIWTGHWN